MSKKPLVWIMDSNYELETAKRVRLIHAGFRVAVDVQSDAIFSLPDHHPDVLVLDLNWLHTNRHALRQAFRDSAFLPHIPMIVCGTLTEKQVAGQGFTRYLKMPYHGPLLIDAVHDAVQTKKQRQPRTRNLDPQPRCDASHGSPLGASFSWRHTAHGSVMQD